MTAAHRVEARPEEGGTAWRSTVEVSESRELAIPLKGYWADPVSGLTWATAHNGVAQVGRWQRGIAGH